MKDEMKRMNKGFMRKDGKFFLPITHESLVVDNDGVSISKKYLTADGLAGYATETYVQDAILQAQIGGAEVDLSNYATIDQLNEKADKSEIPVVDVDKAYVDAQIEEHAHDEYATEQFVEEKIAEIDLSQSHVHENKAVLDTITLANINNWDSKSDFSGSYNDLTDKPEIEGFATEEYVDTAVSAKANKSHAHYYSDIVNAPKIPSIEGLASEEYVDEKIAAIEIPEVSEYDDSEVKARLDALEKIDHDVFLTEHQDISGKADVATVEAVDERVKALEAIEHHMQPNFTYKINMIEAGKEPFVETTGEFPNLVMTFNIPMGVAAEPEPEVEAKMWIGWIPFDQEAYDNGTEPTMGYSAPEHVDANMTMDIIQFGIDNGTVEEMKPQVLNKHKVGLVSEAGFIICVVPKDKNYVVTVDDGFGSKIPFQDNNWQVPQNGTELVNQIDGVTYCLTGGMASISGNWYLYVDEQ